MGLPRTLRTQGRTLPGIWQLSSWRSGDGIPSVCISFRILSSLADNQHRFLFLLLYVFSLLHIHNRILFIFFRCSKHKYIRPRSVVSCRFRDTKCSALSTHIHCTLRQITNWCSKNLSLVKYCWLIDLKFSRQNSKIEVYWSDSVFGQKLSFDTLCITEWMHYVQPLLIRLSLVC